MIRAIAPLLRLWAAAYYRWAAKEMGATHPDLPWVVLRIRELESPQ